MSLNVSTRARGAAAEVVEQLETIILRDPSVRSRGEAMLHPSVVAVLGHRVAHRLYRRRMRKAARALSMVIRVASGGIEIHPGAQIGRRFFVDHGCGVVVGETCVIGDDVTLFHQVTLGSTGWWNDAKRAPGARRHPELRNGVTVGCNATILGPVVVGERATIGAQALVLADVPPRGLVHAPRSAVIDPAAEHLRLAASTPQSSAPLPIAIVAA